MTALPCPPCHGHGSYCTDSHSPDCHSCRGTGLAHCRCGELASYVDGPDASCSPCAERNTALCEAAEGRAA